MAEKDDDLLDVFLRLQPHLIRYFSTRTRSREDSEDLAQEAWIKLSRNGAAALAAPAPYLRRIARSLAIDHSRSPSRYLTSTEVGVLLNVADQRPTPERMLEHRDTLDHLRRAMDELTPRQRAMLIASRFEKQRHRDIAEAFGVSIRTVEMEIRKAIDHCGERLAKLNRK
ncbi:RNA polymerase sigma factor [Ensifer adhaerens]|uniref:RNA polymerase sigma factor n=1 Tax=Ensifer adhaerens TaxID=106592 RepID=UPI0009901F08|nr:RNA polymerase sigma factor [Ensifer adhaerens]